MNLLKTLGLGVYYRVRRISKAFKNWKKFGVVIFGSMFLASSLLGGQIANAATPLSVRINPNIAAGTVGTPASFSVSVEGVAPQASDTIRWFMGSNGAEPAEFHNKTSIAYTPTAAQAGTTVQIRALIYRVGGQAGEAYATLRVASGPATQVLTSAAIGPDNIFTVVKGKTKQLQGRAYDQYAKEITSGVTYKWSMVNATAGSISSTGLFTAGTTTGSYDRAIKVTATQGSAVKEGFAKVMVSNDDTARILTTVDLTPDPPLNPVDPNKTIQFTARAFDQYGVQMSTADGISFTFSANATAGTINQMALFLAKTPGFYKDGVWVVARQASQPSITKTDYSDVTVNGVIPETRVLTSAAIGPDNIFNIQTSKTKQLVPHAYDQKTVEFTSGIVYSWNMDKPQAGSITAGGLFTAGTVAGQYKAAIRLTAKQGTTKTVYAYADVTVSKAAEDNLLISILPSATQNVTPNTPVQFTPNVTWNGGVPQAGTVVDWYVNDAMAVSNAAYGANFNFVRSTEGTYKVYAIAQYSTKEAKSNEVLVHVQRQTQTLTVDILEASQTLTLPLNGVATRPFTFAAYHGQDAYTPIQKLWTVTGGGAIDPVTGVYTTTSTSNAVTVKIQVWDEDGQTAYDTLTFNVVAETQNVKRLASVTLVPAVFGPVLSGTPVPYIAYGWDQDGAEIAGNINFTWNLINGTVGSLTTLQTGYHGTTTLNTYSTVVTGTYYPLSATGHFVDTAGGVWNITSATAQLMLSQIITQDVLNSVTAVAVPASIYVGGDISTLTAQGYNASGVALNSGVSYTWSKISGPSNFISTAYGQSVQIASDTTIGTATYRVTANYAGDSSSKTADVTVVINPRTSHTLTVNITPDPVYGVINSDQPVRATVLYDGADVTGLSFIDWTMLNSTAGALTYENQANATVRTGNTLGTFGSAIQVYATYSGMSAYDVATVVVTDSFVPTYLLNWSLNGVIEDGSTPSEGDVIVYTLQLTNNQTTTLTNVRTSVDVPTYTTFLSAASAVDHPSIYGRTITWDAGTFVPGATKTMTFRVTINDKLSKRGVSITAYGRVAANEIAGFNINSNTIRVAGSGGTTPSEPLPSTGADAMILGLLAVVSLGLSVLTYRLIARRATRAN